MIFGASEIKFIGGVSGGEMEGTMGFGYLGTPRYSDVLKRIFFRKCRYNGFWISLDIWGYFSHSHIFH